MKLCVTSEAEFQKCVRMSTALRAQVTNEKIQGYIRDGIIGWNILNINICKSSCYMNKYAVTISVFRQTAAGAEDELQEGHVARALHAPDRPAGQGQGHRRWRRRPRRRRRLQVRNPTQPHMAMALSDISVFLAQTLL